MRKISDSKLGFEVGSGLKKSQSKYSYEGMNRLYGIKKKPECFGDFNTAIHGCFKNNCELVESCRRQLHKNYVKAVKEFKLRKQKGIE